MVRQMMTFRRHLNGSLLRQFSDLSAKKFSSLKCSASNYSLITTPIFYVNSRPHIGHLYSAVIADAYHRFQKIKHGHEFKALLFTGTDEHGMKIEKAAKAAGCKSVKEHCDGVSSEFRKMCDHFTVDYRDFIRTTEDRHKKAVSHFWVGGRLWEN